MKKCLSVLVILVLFCSISLVASAGTETTGRGIYKTPIAPLTTWLNTNDDFLHGHNYEQYQPRFELGLMGDVIFYREEILSIPYALGVQSHYDFNNANWGAYGKVSVDLSSMVKGFLGQK
ncbi:hypothetical protein LCGC14_2170920 [marine sediment metagenome]|uniref:Uncharacterized protein n=1 Tax=marine sediment metagenome TaxID=412755 RepID=A0A0F9DQ99_9ZZZZ